MDWTSIFDETGEEELIIPKLMEEHPTEPRLVRLVNKLFLHDECPNEMNHHRLMVISEFQATSPTYSLRALYYLTINYILGVGCLGIPYAFARAGFLLCSTILLTVTVCSYMTVMWVAETGRRYEIQKRSVGKDEVSSEATSLLDIPGSQTRETLDVGRYEVIDLVSHYLGPIHTFIYQASLLFLMYVGLLAYTQVFCGSISALIWGEEGDRPMGLSQFIFAVMVIPLSCMELDEQVSIQSLMATARFVAIFIMVVGSLVALFTDNKNSAEPKIGIAMRSHPPYWASPDPEGCHMSYIACFSGFGVAFSTALFSQLFQHSVPGLLRPLRAQPQLVSKAPRVFGASLVTTFTFYLFLGISAASYFGANTKSSVNLNFANFYFGFDKDATSPWLLRLLQVASSIVVIFPALDTISVFPLIANTLGNNLYAASNPSFLKWIARQMATMWQISQNPRGRRRYSDLCFDDRKVLLQEASRAATVLWRLVAAIPPLVGSIWATDLSFSLLLSGVAGLYVAFFAPSLLQLCSSRVVQDTTVFRGWYSHPAWAYPVIGFAGFALWVVVSQINDALQGMH
jgi:amino acid permease